MSAAPPPGGLLIAGELVQVPGVRILPPRGESWVTAARGNARSWRPQLKIIHKTIADDRELVIDVPGPSDGWGGVFDTVEDWHKRGVSGTHLVTGHDGTAVCISDLVRFEHYHAGAWDADANPRSWGHEIKEHKGGGVHRVALKTTVAITLVDTRKIGVQWQTPIRYLRNKPLSRFALRGGADLVGVFGHRDVTHERGEWDPGYVVISMLQAEGFEVFDFEAKQDLDTWARRQEWLQREGHYHGAIDGIAGPATTKALLELGYPDGILALGMRGAEALPQPPGGW